MVHGFAKQSGGFLEIYSEAGYGTAVSFYLPREEPTEEKADVAPGSKLSHGASSELILVVEDDPRVRQVTVKRLQHLGYHTIEAESGVEALEILAQNNDIQVVFTDMVMPGGMNGAELLEEVSRKYPKLKKLVTSGYADDGLVPNHDTKWLRKP